MSRPASALWVLTGVLAIAQPPDIGQNGVTNAASRMPPALPGGVLARGARFMISGVRLDRAEVAIGRPAQPVPTFAAAAERIEAMVPLRTPLGDAEVTVRRGGLTSRPFKVRIVAAQIGLYSRNGAGWGPGRIRNADGSQNSFANSAAPKSKVVLTATGAGGLAPAVFIAGHRASNVSLKPMGPDEELTFEIPPGTPEGCWVPVYAVSPGAVAPSNVVTLAIHSKGGTCAMPGPIPLVTGSQAGIVVLTRLDQQSQSRKKFTEDEGFAAFVTRKPGPAVTPFLMTPPAGTCMVYTGSAQSPFSIPTSIGAGILSDLGDAGVDSGPAITVRQAGQERVLPRTPGAVGYYHAPMGAGESRRRPLFLGFEPTVLSGPAFEVTGRGPRPIEWIGKEQTETVDRSQGVAVKWKPLPGVVFIVATNTDPLTTARAMTYCVENGERGTFEIPAAALANFPASGADPGPPLSQLAIATVDRYDARSAAMVFMVYASIRAVTFR